MKNSLRAVSVFWLAIGICCLPGCGGDGGGPRVDTYPVKGSVTFNGEALSRGSIAFSPVDPTKPTATGSIGADGTYTLRTYEAGDGAVPGECVVIIEAWTEEMEEFLDEEETKPNPDFKEAEPLVPQRYTVAGLTPLRATVEAKEGNEFSFALEGKASAYLDDPTADDDPDDE